MRTNTLSLLRSAFELRSQGMTWNEIGKHLRRKGKSCQQWTWRYRDHWHLFDQDAQRSLPSARNEQRLTLEIQSDIEAKTTIGDERKIKNGDITGQKMPSVVLKDHGSSLKMKNKSLTGTKEITIPSGTCFALFLSIWQRLGLLWMLFQTGHFGCWSAFKTILKVMFPIRWLANPRSKAMSRFSYPPEPVCKVSHPRTHNVWQRSDDAFSNRNRGQLLRHLS